MKYVSLFLSSILILYLVLWIARLFAISTQRIFCFFEWFNPDGDFCNDMFGMYGVGFAIFALPVAILIVGMHIYDGRHTSNMLHWKRVGIYVVIFLGGIVLETLVSRYLVK